MFQYHKQVVSSKAPRFFYIFLRDKSLSIFSRETRSILVQQFWAHFETNEGVVLETSANSDPLRGSLGVCSDQHSCEEDLKMKAKNNNKIVMF